MMLVPHNTTSLATLRAPSVGRRAVMVAVLAILAAVAIALSMVSLRSSGTTSATPAGANSPSTLIRYRGLGLAPSATAGARVPSPATIGLARAEHSYGLVP